MNRLRPFPGGVRIRAIAVAALTLGAIMLSGCASVEASSTSTPISTDNDILAEHNLDGLDVGQLVNALDSMPLTDRPDGLTTSITAEALTLTDQHKQDLDRIYNVLQDKLEGQNKILNSIKEAGDDLTKFVKKIGSPFRELPPAPDNDNKQPPGENTWLPWKRRGNGPDAPKP